MNEIFLAPGAKGQTENTFRGMMSLRSGRNGFGNLISCSNPTDSLGHVFSFLRAPFGGLEDEPTKAQERAAITCRGTLKSFHETPVRVKGHSSSKTRSSE